MSRKIKLEDTLGEASSFVKAIRMATADMDATDQANAIDVLAEQIQLRLEQARCVVDTMRERD
jgi:hypothetical protein